MTASALQIRVLGELEVLRAGRPLALPASKKTRGLLGHLVVAGKPQLRERLCELLWNVPDDPRASLRWSLSKLRRLLDDGGTRRLVADRERVGLELADVDVDLLTARRALVRGAAQSATEELEAAVTEFRGELLEGLDLPDCFRFHEWCITEREKARSLRVAALTELVGRLAERPQVALGHARVWLAVDPLSEAPHIAVARILARLGRKQDALDQIESCRRIMEQELGRKPAASLDPLRIEIARAVCGPSDHDLASAPRSAPARSAERPGTPTGAFIGRHDERKAVAEAVAAAARGQNAVLIVLGEPGIGKTRLLEEVAAQVRASGGQVMRGRAFEAEMVRPYGAWIDALRSGSLTPIDDTLRYQIAPDPREPSWAEASNRSQLFDAVARALGARALVGHPVAVLIDDAHWLDDASAALTHYIARELREAPMVLALAARPGELPDNPAALRVVRTLGREGARELTLRPLDERAVGELIGSETANARRVFAESAGNPLFALEIARALARGESLLEGTLGGLIQERLARSEPTARALLPWAAALGGRVDPTLLGRISGIAPAELLTALEDLERRGILQVVPLGDGTLGYDFAHDLFRQSAYRQISEPRRCVAHRHIAQALAQMPDPHGAIQGDVAHHAALGGEVDLCVRASIAAGQRCMRLFAFEEAAELADRALPQLERLSGEGRFTRTLELLRLYVYPGISRARGDQIERVLSRLFVELEEGGLRAEMQEGFDLLAYVHYYREDFARAQESMQRSLSLGRSEQPAVAARRLAETARCLVHIERDVPKAQALFLEAQQLAKRAGCEVLELPWVRALLRHFLGDLDGARLAFEEALALAIRQCVPWAEWDCRARLVLIDLERDEPARALSGCAELLEVAAKLGDGSEAPFSQALRVLARLRSGDAEAAALVEASTQALRRVNSKAHLALVLACAAEMDLARGDAVAAHAHGTEALSAAEATGRPGLVVLARSALAAAALMVGDAQNARKHVEAAEVEQARPFAVNATARAALAKVAVRLKMALPTETPTDAPTAAPQPTTRH